MPKTALGTKKRAAVRNTMRGKIGNASKTAETTPNKGSTVRQVSPPGQQDDAQGCGRRKPVCHAAAHVVADSDAGKHHPDDAGPGIEGHSDAGSQNPGGHNLENKPAGAGHENDQVRLQRSQDI